jgi:electron transfer flavoprotein alpha/beta subunit
VVILAARLITRATSRKRLCAVGFESLIALKGRQWAHADQAAVLRQAQEHLRAAKFALVDVAWIPPV